MTQAVLKLATRPYCEYTNDSILRTIVLVKVEDTLTQFQAVLEGDWRDKTEQELIDATLAYIHKNVMISFALPGYIQKTEELAPAIEQLKEASTKLDNATQMVIATALDLGNTVYDNQDVLSQLLERMGLMVNEDGMLVSTNDSEVEGGE